MGGLKINQKIICVLAMLTMAILYNNCSAVEYGSSSANGTLNNVVINDSNGAGYDGKPRYFSVYDTGTPCTQLKSNGTPLPNAQIRATSANVSLIRESCQDIEAVELTVGQYSLDANDNIVYAGQTFTADLPSEFQSLNAICPAGLQPLANPIRTNLFALPLELDDHASWDPFGDTVFASIYGGFSGLPSFELTRQVDASAAREYRLKQLVGVQANSYYALSVFAKAGTSNLLKIDMFRTNTPTNTWGMAIFDLTTGALVSEVLEDLTQVSYAAVPVDDGFLITFYFQTAAIDALDIGFAPGDFAAGQTVIVAAPRVESITSFCQ